MLESMAENPFQSPSTESAQESGKPKRTIPLVSIVAVLAATTGLCFASNISAPVLIVPAVAVLLVSATTASRGRATTIGLRWVAITALVAFAGYIAFATTCCCTNFALADPPDQYGPEPVHGGIVSAICTVVGCYVAYWLSSMRREKPSSVDG